MGQILIRNIDDDVLERFRQQAKREGKSAEQLAREAIGEKAKPSREEIWRELDALRARTRPARDLDIVAEIRKDREERGLSLPTDKDRDE